ncbi:MAG: HesA/MoeB/ThiF family protein [Pseudomonadota bacterium]
MTSADHLTRHKRHLLLKEIGGPGVAKLAAAKVTLIGAGALGGPCALYLAAAGVGQIEVFDGDVVDLSNLQRQVQFSQSEIGANKAEALCARLCALNSDIVTVARPVMFARNTQPAGDILIDATDTFAARFDINGVASEHGSILVSGAAIGWAGQVGVFAPGRPEIGPCYRCLVPEDPDQDEDCETLGVVGAVTGITGARMALEVIKHVTGAGAPGMGHLWRVDGLTGQSRVVRVPADPACPHCA